jgi:cation/acetate symporter
MIGTAGLPHVIIRFFTVPKVADARWSAGWALVFIALLYTTAPGRGRDGASEPDDTIQNGPVGAEERQPRLRRASGLDEELGRPACWFEDKNGDGRIQYYNDKNAESFDRRRPSRAGKATS